MIGRVPKIRHALVGAAIGGTSLLAGTGVIGGGTHPERFDAKTVVVEPSGDGLRITEYVDIDFGSARRHGYERVIPNDFGVPTDVAASSPDADDGVDVTGLAGATRIRVGDPDTTFTGQHRYALSYTLPDARFDELGLDLDIVFPPGGIYPGDQETGRFEVVVTGFELTDTFCDVGRLGATGGCELIPWGDAGTYVAVVEPLRENDGFSIGGAIVDRVDPATVAPPPIPERRSPSNTGLLAGGVAALGAAGALPVYRRARRKGRNEVFAGGAADAAYGEMPPPRADGTAEPPPPVHLVADDDMAALATIEFVPPKGIEPWQAAVLLTERLGDDTVESWFSGLVAKEAIEISDVDGDLVISSGPARGELAAPDAELLHQFLSIDDPYTTGTYDPEFAAAWRGVEAAQRRRIVDSGWWTRLPPGSGLRSRGGSPVRFVIFAAFGLVWVGSGLSAVLGAFRSPWLALVLGLVFPATVAYFVYRVMLPARSAQGSALALRAESFRRFLHASEGEHVEWAWSKGLLREYSAWAVALGEADAWSKALERANVPAPALAAAAPIIIHQRGSSMRDTRTAPSQSSGGSSGGGLSGGGGVGGGGGGGSSGSW